MKNYSVERINFTLLQYRCKKRFLHRFTNLLQSIRDFEMFLLFRCATSTLGQKKSTWSRGLQLISTRLDIPLQARNEKNRNAKPIKLSSNIERIAKRIAASGVCSRRQAETFIQDGKVMVNGQAISCPSKKVTTKDVVQVNGHLLATTFQTKIWLANKLKGVRVLTCIHIIFILSSMFF